MQHKWKKCRTPEHWVCDFCNNVKNGRRVNDMKMWHYGERAICIVCVRLIGELNAA